MKLDIVEKKKNPMLKREEIFANLEHEGKATPNRKDIVSVVEKELKAKSEMIIIDRVFTRRGIASSEVRILIYKKKEDIPEGKLEKMKRTKKKVKTEGASAEEKPKEAEKPESKSEKESKPEKEPESKQNEPKGEPEPKLEKTDEKPEEPAKTEKPKKEKIQEKAKDNFKVKEQEKKDVKPEPEKT